MKLIEMFKGTEQCHPDQPILLNAYVYFKLFFCHETLTNAGDMLHSYWRFCPP